MWSRSNYSSLDNSLSLKFEIAFYPDDRSVYNCISIKLHRCSRSWIAIKVDLNNHVAHDKLASSLGDIYRLSVWKSEESQRSWINLDLKSVDKSEAENVFSMINSVVPCTLAADAFGQAFSDILTKVIPTEKKVPWGQGIGLFDRSVSLLSEQVKSEMSNGLVNKP